MHGIDMNVINKTVKNFVFSCLALLNCSISSTLREIYSLSSVVLQKTICIQYHIIFCIIVVEKPSFYNDRIDPTDLYHLYTFSECVCSRSAIL